MILMTGGDKITSDAIGEREADWLERVWMDVQNEIAFETRHPQHLHGTVDCPGCKLPLVDE